MPNPFDPNTPATATTYEYNGQQYNSQEEAQNARQDYILSTYADAASVGFDQDRFNHLIGSGYGISQMSNAERQYISKKFLSSADASTKYKNSATDKYLASVGLPPMSDLSKYRTNYAKYASGGGIAENYGNVSEAQWKKINELWAKDWEYGLTDTDYARKASGRAPSAYDDMYEDTLLDDELKAAGLPPSKLLNGKLGETYNAWMKNAQDYSQFYDDAMRRYISENEKGKEPISVDKYTSFADLGKAMASVPKEYTMENALADTMNDPKWMEFAQSHYGMSMSIPNPDDDEFLVIDKDTNVPVLDDDGNKVYDQEKYMKAWDKAVKNNLGLNDDEFAITLDKFKQQYEDRGQEILADMRTEEWFNSKGIKFDYNNRYSNAAYVAKMNDFYAGESINEGEGYTLEMLYPDVQFTDEERIQYQPVIDELNRLRVEQGYQASYNYLSSGEFTKAVHAINNDRIVATMREKYADVPGYDKKTDAEILHSYYAKIGSDYLMNDAEIAQLESGELSVAQYMTSKCANAEDAEAFATAQYEKYCEDNYLPKTIKEWREARKARENTKEYLATVGSMYKSMSENEWEAMHKRYAPIASKYTSASEAQASGQLMEWQQAVEMEKNYESARRIFDHIHEIDKYWNPAKNADQQSLDNTTWDNAYAQRLAYQADALAYTPEFAAKTADKEYVNQRFEQIVDNWGDSLTHKQDDAIAAFATDEDKAKVVYMFDRTSKTDPNRIAHTAAETYLNKYAMREWDALRRMQQMENTNYFGDDKSEFLGGTGTVVASIFSGIGEGVWNFALDTATIVSGHEIYSSNRSNWTKDVMADLTEDIDAVDKTGIGSFAVNLIPSMAQSAASMALAHATGGASEAFTLALMGMQSYSNAVDDALRNGASSEQAYVYGLINGANEIIFEKLSLDKFIADINVTKAVVDTARATGKYSNKQLAGIFAKKILQHANTQGFVEGSEEFFTSIANLLAENLVLADHTAFDKTVQHYMEAGMSEENAKKIAGNEIVRDVVMDFVGGYVSGALMAFGGDMIRTSGGRMFMDRTGVTDFVLQTHNLSLVSFDDALAYAQENLQVDSDGKISAKSAAEVFNDLRKQGADSATLSRVMNSYSDNATPDAMTEMQSAIAEQKNEDGKKLTKAASKYVYNRVANGKSNVTKGQIEFATKEWLDHYSGAVQQGDLRALENNARMMREGYIEDIARLAGNSYVATGMESISAYYATLPADVQAGIDQNAQQYIRTFSEAFADGNRAAQYANAAAIMEYAVGEGKALQGLNSIFGDGAAVAPQAVRNAVLGTDSTTAQRYIDRVAEGIALLQRQNGSRLFSAAQNGVDATAYVATQFALAQSMPHDSLARSMYDYISKYGSKYGTTNEAMDLLTAATIHESNSPFARQIRLTAGTFYTSEQLQQITDEYQKALTDYNEKLKIKQAHEQADAQERTEHESRIANYTAQVEQLEKNVKEDTSLAKTFGSRVAELQTAKSAFETLVAKQNQRMTQTNADVNEAERKYKAAKTKYWNAMQDQSAQYIQRFGSSLEAIKGRQRISHAELTRMSALAQFGTAENLNDINTKIIASEKASAVALGRALGVDVQCVEFGKAFFDEKKIAQSNRNETSPGVVIGGTVYLNTKVMEARVGSLTDQVLMHELGHILESSADNYKKYAKFAKDFLIKRDGKGAYDFAKKAFMESGMTEQQAERELVAEFTRQVTLADPRAVAALCKSAPKMSMRIFQWLTNTRNRMNSVATAQSKIIIDAQREFASGMKAIRNTEVAEQSTDDADVSLSPSRNAMTNAMRQLEERMRLEAENQRNAAQQQTDEQQPAQPAQTEQRAEAQTETEAPAEETPAKTAEEIPAQPVVEEAEQPMEAVEETPAEAAEETAEEQTTKEPQEDFADVVLEEPQTEETSSAELPFELTDETRQRIMRVVAQLRTKNADSEGRVPKKTNDTIANVVKNQVTHDANYVDTPADVLDAFAEQFKAPQNDVASTSESEIYERQRRLMQSGNRNAPSLFNEEADPTRVNSPFSEIQGARYYTEYDPQALEIQRSIDELSERENIMSGRPRMIQTDNGYMVARQVSREGFVTGNPMFNTNRQNMAMIAPVSEFRGDVKRAVPVSQCTAVVVPNTDAYAETRADARDAGASVYAYDESDPSQFDRAIDRAANMSSVAYFPSMTYDELIDRYNAIPQGMKPRVENRPVPRQTTDTNRVSQTARTIAEAPITTEQGYSDIQSWIVNDNAGTFEPVSNTKSLNRARGVIERAGSLSQAADDLHSAVANGDGKATDLLARAELLYAEAQNPNSGLSAIQREHIFSDLCMIASDAGRALQLTSQLKRMTPEGHIDYIEQVGKRMADKYNKRTKKDVDLSLTEEEKEGYRRAVTDEQRKEIDKEVGKRWAEETKDLPLLERIRNWRYFAMLGNPRTHFRNMVGNALMNPVARLKDFNNAWLQAAFKIDEADRTTALWTGKVDAATKQFVDEQLKRMLPIMQSGSSKYMEEIAKVPAADDEIEGSWLKRTAKALTQPVNSARLSNSEKGWGGFWNKLSYINSNALEMEDAMALGLRFRSSMYQIIKARGLDVTNMTNEQLESIVNYSAQEALRATFRDASALADALNRFANTNRWTRFAMEAIVPFKKTPINIAKRSVEYSPLGLVNGFYKLFSNSTQYKSGLAEIDANTKLTDAQKQQRRAELETKHKQQKIVAIDRLAQGVTGSLLAAIGYFAASMGWISIGRKDDDKASFEQSLGKNAYSLNLGDMSIDLSAFSPAAVPMLMGTALYQSQNAEHDPNLVSMTLDVLAESIDPITEMSMISGIADALSGIGSQREDGANTRWAMQILGNASESYIGQFVPTFVGQTERAFDPYARSYTAGDEYWASKVFGSEIGTAVKGLQNKAGFGWLSEPKVNLHGEPQRNYTNFGSRVLNALNNWILPATIKVDQKNEIDDELVRLYGVVDSADIFPSKPSRNLGQYTDKKTNKTTQIKLTDDKEYMEYQKEYGQTVYDLLGDLMTSREYRFMTDAQRADAIEKIIDQAKSATKKRWKAKKIANLN